MQEAGGRRQEGQLSSNLSSEGAVLICLPTPPPQLPTCFNVCPLHCIVLYSTVEPRYYVPRLQRFHPYNVQIPKSRISVMHYILYRYRLQHTPLQRNFRYNVQISRKNMKNGLRYNVQRGSISAMKRAKGR